MYSDYGERMARLETTLSVVQKSSEETKNDVKALREDFRHFVESADERYANKMVERGFYGLVALIVVIVLTYIIKGALI
jgi:sensor domain CHASE-containing protein